MESASFLLPLAVLLSSCPPPSSGEYGGHDLFTSLAELHELWKDDRAVVADIRRAIDNMDAIKESLER